eukprot:m.133236 g.133236  ORF g.133236 m.133236 type:complete len:91 (-) comp14823_c1_seq5:790-1062(-)
MKQTLVSIEGVLFSLFCISLFDSYPQTVTTFSPPHPTLTPLSLSRLFSCFSLNLTFLSLSQRPRGPDGACATGHGQQRRQCSQLLGRLSH